MLICQLPLKYDAYMPMLFPIYNIIIAIKEEGCMYLPDEKSIVGRNLQILINQKNWSIKQAAKELNYDRINLSKMLSGSQNFRIKTLVKFAHFFDVPVFLLFNRLFEDEQYRKDFSFVDEDYMHVFRVNFKATSVKQSLIDLDSTTVSHIINGRRNNPTISTLHQFAEYSNTSLSELFKTEIDKIIIKQKEEDSI